MMLIIFYGIAKRLEKIFSPYGPIYSRKLIQLTQWIPSFIRDLNRQHQTLLLLGGIPLSFDRTTNLLVKKFLYTAVGKISRIKADFLSWQKPLASQLRVLADNFSLLPAPQRVLAAWFKIFN